MRKRLGDREILFMAVLFCILIPFLLPSMHERYYYLADILTVVCAFTLPRLFAMPLLVQFASYAGYYAYLYRAYLVDLRYGTVALGLAALFALAALVQSFRRERDEDGDGPPQT